MASSTTSVEGDHSLTIRYSVQQHKSTNRNRQRNRSKIDPQQQQRVGSYPGSSVFITKMESNLDAKTNSNSKNAAKNRHQRRHLREKRRATGVAQVLSTESAGGTSTGEEESDNEKMSMKKNAQFNEICSVTIQNDESPDELRAMNEELKQQLRIKEEYIQKLELTIKQLNLKLVQNS